MNPHHASPTPTDPQPSTGMNPWPIALTILIVAAFLSAAWVAFTMIRQSVDLVRPDYYEQDLKHSERMEQERRAQGLENPLRIDYDASAQTITLHYPSVAASGSVHLYRPSDSALDRIVDIAPDAAARQVLDASALATGLWRIQVSWRQNDQDYLAADTLVVR
ncbi:MAG TPA: FixH family protein [Kiritimatiellia bacterium]|nr:FixH family protein [Kiritimatiellia bacterium]HMP00424.1 FixH family protein [Kiritimatiellia bacterium]